MIVIEKYYEKLLLLGLFATLFTKLRFFNLPIGIGEVILIFTGLYIAVKVIIDKNYKIIYSNIFIKFWLISLVLLLCGYIYLQYIDFPSIKKHAVHDILAYLFVIYTLSILIYTKYLKYSYENMLEKFIYFTVVFYSILLTLALQIEYLTYGSVFGRISFLSSNPNQIALLFTVVPFLVYYYRDKNVLYIQKFNYSLLILLSLIITYKIDSNALALGIIIGFIFYIFLQGLNSKYKHYIKKIFPILFFISILLVGLDFLSGTQIIFLKSDISVRFLLYMNGIKAFTHSIFFGLGPGAHSYFELTEPIKLWESHNIYIDWLTQTGMIGLLLLFYLIYKIVQPLYINGEYILIAALISLLVFSFFHQTLRQPIFWFYLFYFYAMGERSNKCVE